MALMFESSMHVRLLVASAVTVLIFGATPDPVRTMLPQPPSNRPKAQGRVLNADDLHDPSLELRRAHHDSTWSVHRGMRADSLGHAERAAEPVKRRRDASD